MTKLLLKIFLGITISFAVVMLALPACGLFQDSNSNDDSETVTYGPELIANGNFDDSTNWEFYIDSSSLAIGNGTFIDGMYVMQMTQLSQNDTIRAWHAGLKYIGNIPLTQGSIYEISFDAKATGMVEFGAGLGLNKEPWTYYGGFNVDLSTEMGTFTGEFVMHNTDDAASSLLFAIGNHLETVTVDNISIREKIIF